MTRLAIAFAVSALFLTATAAEAADCKTISMITQVKMTPLAGYNVDLAPFTLNGKRAIFLFDTGGSMTLLTETAAQTLGLIIQPSNIRTVDMRGKQSDDMTTVRDFSLGTMKGSFGRFPVRPNLGARRPDPWDGVLALDYLRLNDVEADFGTDTLTIISPDHCPGYVPYSSGAVGVVPFTKSQDQQQMVVQVMLDGQQLNALIDTGASQTSMRNDIAESLFKLNLGTTDTPENKFGLNGDANLKTYRHVFGGLSFGDITVKNARIDIYPNAVGGLTDRWEQATRSAQTDIINAPQMVIGMDVLRHLRLFMSFSESRLYISPATVPVSKSAQ